MTKKIAIIGAGIAGLTVAKKLVKQNENIVEEDFVKLGFTFDHRVMDGKHIAQYISIVQNLINEL